MTDQATTPRTDVLPMFEDEPVNKSTVRITKTGDGLSEALDLEPVAFHMDEKLCFVLRGTVSQINHLRGPNGEVIRRHTVEADDISPIDPEVADEILSKNRDRLSELRDARVGQQRLAVDGEAEEPRGHFADPDGDGLDGREAEAPRSAGEFRVVDDGDGADAPG